MRSATLILAFMMLTGCANIPHNNVLLFGTDTKFALDISSAATQGGAPQITIGYRRAEAVWMPLVANRQTCDAQGNCQTTTALSGEGTGGVEVMTGEDFETGDGKDAYSVFASFGAKFSGEASVGEVSGSGGLAQFFATGIAAQRLAANPGVEAALKINNPGAAGAEADAKQAEVDKTLAEVRLAELEKELGEQQFQSATEAGRQAQQTAMAEATVILSRCGGPDGGVATWQSRVAQAATKGLSTGGKLVLERSGSNAEVRQFLEANDAYRKPFIDNLSTICA
ncbi:MAG: hypothetical protein AAF674_20600 [Pseudomonadota bacterium]